MNLSPTLRWLPGGAAVPWPPSAAYRPVGPPSGHKASSASPSAPFAALGTRPSRRSVARSKAS